MATRKQVCLSVCTRCRPADFAGADHERPGHRLAEAVLSLAQGADPTEVDLTLRGIHCMSQCKRPCVVALSAPEKFTLLFGDLQPETDAADILSLARQYAESDERLVPRPDRPACLRSGILGRVPPLGYSGELRIPAFSLSSNRQEGSIR